MFCPYCGTEQETEDARFCARCGKPLNGEQTQPAAQQPDAAAAPVAHERGANAPEAPQQQVLQTTAPTQQAPATVAWQAAPTPAATPMPQVTAAATKQGPSTRTIIIIAICAALVVIAAALVVFTPSGSSKTDGDSTQAPAASSAAAASSDASASSGQTTASGAQRIGSAKVGYLEVPASWQNKISELDAYMVDDYGAVFYADPASSYKSATLGGTAYSKAIQMTVQNTSYKQIAQEILSSYKSDTATFGEATSGDITLQGRNAILLVTSLPGDDDLQITTAVIDRDGDGRVAVAIALNCGFDNADAEEVLAMLATWSAE